MIYSKDIIERFRAAATASVADACDIVVKDKRCVMDYAMRPRVKETDRYLTGSRYHPGQLHDK